MDKSVFYEELTALQLKNLQQKNAVILFSMGSIEQHSSHLPVGTDYLCSRKRAANIASQCNCIVFSPLQLGYSFNHVGMFSTISISVETLINLLRDIFLQLCDQGWKRFIIMSGHAGNWGAIEVAVQLVREKFPRSQFIVTKGIPSVGTKYEIERFYKNFDQHAGKVETALVSYYYPNLLDKNNIPTANVSLPGILKRHIAQTILDEVDVLLIKAYTPQKTVELSDKGNWGVQDPHDYVGIPIEKVMKAYENYFVRLISRWDTWEEEQC
jgi:creatinine amidohydrolase